MVDEQRREYLRNRPLRLMSFEEFKELMEMVREEDEEADVEQPE